MIQTHKELEKQYRITLVNQADLREINAIIIAVAHNQYRQLDLSEILSENGVIIDVKGVSDIITNKKNYWRL